MPLVIKALVMAGAGKGAIVTTSVAVPDPPILIALNVTGKAPDKAGVPEIAPLVLFIERPAGNPVASKLAGLFLAVIR